MPLPRLFVLGDSISIQYGPFLETMVAGAFDYARKSGLEQALQNLDTPQGANGGDSRMCLKYLKAVLPSGELRADLLLLNCGLHDVRIKPGTTLTAVQVPLTEYRANLTEIVTLLAQHNMQMAWVRTTPVDETQHNAPGQGILRYNRHVDEYNAAADEIMNMNGVPMIDLHGFTLSLGAPAETLKDGRHFHEPVRRLQAAYIAGWVLGRHATMS